MRLAAVLNKLFYAAAVPVDFDAITAQQKHGIDAKVAMNFVGKQATICEHVYTVRESATITQLNLGGKFPNQLITVVIFGKSYKNFLTPPAELYRDKNICVQGRVEDYKGKPQIIVESPDDIKVIN